MTPTFTDYVHTLASGNSPDEATFERALDALRGVLVHELKKRSLWTAPPSYLGITGATTWSDGNALEELLYDAYAFIFVQRLGGLVKQAGRRRSIEGLIFLNVRHFLYEAQKNHDPVGFRVFEVLRGAIVDLIEEGTLHVLDGDPRVRSETVLGPSPGLLPLPRISAADRRQDGGYWEASVEIWCDDLLPGLMTAWKREEAVAPLVVKIRQTVESGGSTFAFRDLMDPLKKEILARWRAVAELEAGEAAPQSAEEDGEIVLVPFVRPSNDFEERQSFIRLVECVEEGIAHRPEKSRTRNYLARLWLYFHQWAAPAWTGEKETAQAELLGDRPSRLPSDRKLAEVLSIPRERFPQLRAKLGELIEQCRQAASTGPMSPPGHPRQKGGRDMDAKNQRDRLLRMTGEAAARVAASRQTMPSGSSVPGVGDVYVISGLPASALGDELPVEWMVLESRAGLCRVVAMDDRPWRGPRDVKALGEDGERRRLRCGVTAWIAAGALAAESRVDSLAMAVVEAARQRVAEASGAGEAAGVEDPEAADWHSRLLMAAGLLAGRSSAEQPEPVVTAGEDLETEVAAEAEQVDEARPRRARAPRFRRLDLAASILLAVALVALAASWQRNSRLQHGMVVAENERLRLAEELLETLSQVNPPAVEMAPDEAVRGDDGPYLRIRPDSPSVYFSFDVLAPDFPSYRLRFVEVTSGREVYVSDPLPPTEVGSLRLIVDSAKFEREGAVRVHLEGVTQDGTIVQLADVYTFEVVLEDGSS